MNRQEKTEQVEELRNLFGGAQLAVLTKFDGLDVSAMVTLRSELRKVAAGYRVVKNTLAKIATKDTELEVLHPHFKGPVGVAFTGEDSAATAKVITQFAKDHPKLEIQAGLLVGGKILESKDIEALAKLPGKDQLRAMLLSALNAAPRNFLGVLTAAPRNFVGVLEARRRSLAGE